MPERVWGSPKGLSWFGGPFVFIKTSQKYMRGAYKQVYDQYIKSTDWLNRKEYVFNKHQEFNWSIRCLKCASTKNLNLHHNYYQTLGGENLCDLDYLCSNCHELWHAIVKNSSNSIDEALAAYYKWIFIECSSGETKNRCTYLLQKIKKDKEINTKYFESQAVKNYKEFSKKFDPLMQLAYISMFILIGFILVPILEDIENKKKPKDYYINIKKNNSINLHNIYIAEENEKT